MNIRPICLLIIMGIIFGIGAPIVLTVLSMMGLM